MCDRSDHFIKTEFRICTFHNHEIQGNPKWIRQNPTCCDLDPSWCTVSKNFIIQAEKSSQKVLSLSLRRRPSLSIKNSIKTCHTPRQWTGIQSRFRWAFVQLSEELRAQDWILINLRPFYYFHLFAWCHANFYRFINSSFTNNNRSSMISEPTQTFLNGYFRCVDFWSFNLFDFDQSCPLEFDKSKLWFSQDNLAPPIVYVVSNADSPSTLQDRIGKPLNFSL